MNTTINPNKGGLEQLVTTSAKTSSDPHQSQNNLPEGGKSWMVHLIPSK